MIRVTAISEQPYQEALEAKVHESIKRQDEHNLSLSANAVGIIADILEAPLEVEVVTENDQVVTDEVEILIPSDPYVEIFLMRFCTSLFFILIIVTIYCAGAPK